MRASLQMAHGLAARYGSPVIATGTTAHDSARCDDKLDGAAQRNWTRRAVIQSDVRSFGCIESQDGEAVTTFRDLPAIAPPREHSRWYLHRP